MCRYYVTRYSCGHRHRILELERDCYLVDADDNSYGCCEKEEYAKYAKKHVASPFRCPSCRNSCDESGEGIFMVTTQQQIQKTAATQTEKKVKKSEEKAIERGQAWSKFRSKEKPVVRNLEGDWRIKAGSTKKIPSAVTAQMGTAGEAVATATKIQDSPELEPEKSTNLVYGAVTILKRR